MPTVRTGDVETYYEERGEGRPIVFVHGAIVDGRQWAPQLTALSDEYRTVAYDVHGHGRTGGSAREAYTVDLFADDLHALVTALDLEDPVVCGLSLGGCIAQAYAARYPDDLAALVLADTFPPRPLDWRERFQRSVLLPASIPFVRLLGYPRVERAMVWLQERLAGERVGGEYRRIERLREEGPRMSTDEFAKVVRALASWHEARVDLAAVDVPTLVLYGEHDAPFVRRQVPALADGIPDVTVRAVPDAGHASNLDDPVFFTAALREFLAERVPPVDDGPDASTEVEPAEVEPDEVDSASAESTDVESADVESADALDPE
jgi:pimeloyl-ACP methyl ester carboxylesterase